MAKNNNLGDFLLDLANTIREKKEITGLINPQDFSAEIMSIKTGEEENVKYLEFIQAYDLFYYLNAPISYIGQSNIQSGDTQILSLNEIIKNYDPSEYTMELYNQVAEIYMNIIGV